MTIRLGVDIGGTGITAAPVDLGFLGVVKQGVTATAVRILCFYIPHER